MMSEENNLPTSSSKLESASDLAIAILADTPLVVNAIASTLARAGLFNYQQVSTKQDYVNLLDGRCDLVLYDARHARITLKEAVSCLSNNGFTIPLLVVNGESNIPAAVAAIKMGAKDYVPSEAISQLPSTIFQADRERSSICLQADCLAQSDRQLQKLITENADGIIVVDFQGIVHFINPAAQQLLGKSQSELIGESLGFPAVNGDFLEVDIPVNADKILIAQMRVSQIQWQGMDAFIVSLRDITQLKQAEEEIAQLLEEAQAANRAKDEFLAVLSHELRTPLNPIVGWSQILARGNLSPEKVKQGAEIIQRNAKLQTQLIGDILDISRIIRGKLELQVTTVNLIDTIQNALETISLAAKAKSLQIVTEFDESIALIQGDSIRLQQVVWNLLSNAVKFTPHHGTVKICLASVTKTVHQLDGSEVEPASSYAQIKVIDSGKGIKPEFLPYVFDYFRQAESGKSRSEGGLGLGLAIVRRLVELHGGEVSADSRGTNQGATFIILLPRLNHSLKRKNLTVI